MRAGRRERLEALLSEFSIDTCRARGCLAAVGGERRRVVNCPLSGAESNIPMLIEPFAGRSDFLVG